MARAEGLDDHAGPYRVDAARDEARQKLAKAREAAEQARAKSRKVRELAEKVARGDPTILTRAMVEEKVRYVATLLDVLEYAVEGE